MSISKTTIFDSIKTKLDNMLKSNVQKGLNPYTVNFIAFCGHGIMSIEGDSFGIIPVFDEKNDMWHYRLLNIDYWARKFSEKENSITIILLSACRTKVTPDILKRADSEDLNEWSNYNNDVKERNLNTNSGQKGICIVLYSSLEG